jgi:hypothetical protein
MTSDMVECAAELAALAEGVVARSGRPRYDEARTEESWMALEDLWI